jgi:hypothetical protein
MFRCRVVCDAVDPGSQGASRFESRKALPHFEMDLLQQVLPSIGIGLIGSRQSFEGAAEGSRHFLVEVVSIRR